MVACQLNGIAAQDQPRYRELVDQLRGAIQRRTELPDGFLYVLDGARMTLTDLGHWVSLERCCCPFLEFTLRASGESTVVQLQLTGPEGVKGVLQAAFGDC